MTRSVFNHRRGATSRYVIEVLSDSPLLYWRLGEASGATTAEDATANNRDGTYTNATAGTNFDWGLTGAIANDYDTAVDFDNDASHARIRRAASTDWDNSNFTIEVWLKLEGSGINIMQIATVGGVNPANWRWAFIYRGNTIGTPLQVWVKDLLGPGVASADTSGLGTTWHHVVLTWDGTDYNFYVDNSNIGTVTASAAQAPQTSVTNQPFVVGANDENSPGGQNWNGLMDEVALYSTALSSTRISAHYNAAL